ncbi:hypothetical protein [Chitinophaga sp. S165]|uniref:hypothetical protein n=1 Tax=Chitinophaga sp. S165 TaxID=2135462 RepID=UPI000D716293|nr:hypothetical protein [Chitinophaga sp. S165]PWV56673.1 hypothetical protein C7475_1011190 [Chitinophaga sp. S165]
MKIKTSISKGQFFLFASASCIVLLLLILLGYVSEGSLFFAIVGVILNAARLTTCSIELDITGITVVWSRFFVEQTIWRPIENISLEIIYSGSSGKPQDAILNVFEGPKCIYQVYANHGFTEDQFKEVILAFKDLTDKDVEVSPTPL